MGISNKKGFTPVPESPAFQSGDEWRLFGAFGTGFQPEKPRKPRPLGRGGFTLIEVVIAIFIVTVGIMAAFSVIQQVITYTATSYNRLIAAYLAQEGVEITRNIRDGNWLASANWQTGLTGCEAPLGCEADYKGASLISYKDRYLKLNSGFYNYSFGTDTKYKRKIFVTPAIDPEGSNILKVAVVVEWQEKGKTNTFLVQENLYNWR